MTRSFSPVSYDTATPEALITEAAGAEMPEVLSSAEAPVLVRLPELPRRPGDSSAPASLDELAAAPLEDTPLATRRDAAEADETEVRPWSREAWPDGVGKAVGFGGMALALSLVVLLSLTYLAYVVIGRGGGPDVSEKQRGPSLQTAPELDISMAEEAPAEATPSDAASGIAAGSPQNSILQEPTFPGAESADAGAAPESDASASSTSAGGEAAPGEYAAGARVTSPSESGIEAGEDGSRAAVQGPQFTAPLSDPPPTHAAAHDDGPVAGDRPGESSSAAPSPDTDRDTQLWASPAGRALSSGVANSQQDEPTASTPAPPTSDRAVEAPVGTSRRMMQYPNTGAPSLRQLLGPRVQVGAARVPIRREDRLVPSTNGPLPLQPRHERIGSSLYQGVR